MVGFPRELELHHHHQQFISKKEDNENDMAAHTFFLLHETYCERNNYSSLLWYVGPSIWTQFKKKVKVTKSQAHSIMSLLENIDWNQLVSIIFGY